MDWSPWNVFEVSDGTEVITQANVASFVAYSLITLLGASVVASLLSPTHTIAWKHSFCKLVLVVVVVVQYWYIALVAVKLTPQLANEVIYSECRVSTKGGKPTGSLRDCMSNQHGFCTREQPCTSCDTPVPFVDFDGHFWSSDCERCSTTNIGACNFDKVNGPYCVASDGVTVEPCRLCCLDSASDALDATLSANNCEAVYESATFSWNATMYECGDPDYPVPTRYGCCPTASQRAVVQDQEVVENERTTLLSGLDALTVSESCMRNGPRGASWSFCHYSDATGVQGVGFTVENVTDSTFGCPVYANGDFVENYCVAPTVRGNVTV